MTRWRALTAAAIALATSTVTIAPAAAAGEQPPECVRVTIAANSGAGPYYHVRFCGTGSGADSPVKDGETGDTFIVDGTPFQNGAVILDPN